MQHYEMKIPGWHTQGEIERKLLFANVAGIFVTFVFGATIAPWLWHLAVWGASHLPFWQPVRPFPGLLDALIHPFWLTGLIWLAYYFLLHAWALFTPHYASWLDQELKHYRTSTRIYSHTYGSPHTSPELPWQRADREEIMGAFLYRPVEEPEDDDDYDSLFHERKPKTTPLSQAWPGEEKYELVERCYAIYRKALERYQPQLIDLKTPPTFFYWSKKTLGYAGSIPVLPVHLLTEEKFEVLLALLAQHLYWHNLNALGDVLDGPLPALTPDHVPGGWPIAWTGNFLWIPAGALRHLKSDLAELMHAHQKALVLEADAFAAMLGQGETFELQLRNVQWEMQQRGYADVQQPTISERIGHLEALNKQARNELRARGMKVKEPPKWKPPRDAHFQIIEEQQRRLGPGSTP
jgi:hypothetical protein